MKNIVVYFALVLCVTLGAANGFGQCAVHRVSAHKEMHHSTAVFVGTVLSAQPVDEAWDFLDGVNYTVRVDTMVHGKRVHSGVMTIFSENSPLSFPMTVGAQYQLFVHPQYDRYEVDNCGNSHALNVVEASNTQPKQVAKAY